MHMLIMLQITFPCVATTITHRLLVITCHLPKMCQDREMPPQNPLWTTLEMTHSKDYLIRVVYSTCLHFSENC